MAPRPGPSGDEITRWLRDIETRMTAIERELDPLVRELESLRGQRVLLQDLLQIMQLRQPAARANGSATNPQSPSPRRESTRDRVHREVVQVLNDIGKPIHINELAVEYETRGFKIPGQGKPANITVHISGWDDIVSPERGIYALASNIAEEETN